VLFLIVRIAYVFTYLGDRPTLRTILWNIGFAINVGIFFMPVIGAFAGLGHTVSRSRGAMRPRFCVYLSPLGAWGTPDARCTRGLVCTGSGRTHTSNNE